MGVSLAQFYMFLTAMLYRNQDYPAGPPAPGSPVLLARVDTQGIFVCCCVPTIFLVMHTCISKPNKTGFVWQFYTRSRQHHRHYQGTRGSGGFSTLTVSGSDLMLMTGNIRLGIPTGDPDNAKGLNKDLIILRLQCCSTKENNTTSYYYNTTYYRSK